jgi:hypothetical protein
MRFTLHFVCAATAASLLASCSTAYKYGPGNLGTDSRIMLTPANQDSVHTAHYFTERISFNLGNGYNPEESCTYSDGSWHMGYSRKYYSCGVGAGIFYGNYKVVKFSPEAGRKNFYGFTGTGQMALNIPIGRYVNWRIIGARSGFAFEGGELYDFRMRNRNYPGFDSYHESPFIWNFGPCSELMVQVNAFRIGLFSGNNFLMGSGRLLGLTSTAGIYAGYSDYNLNYQYTESSHGNSAHELGIIYRFH